MRASPRGGCCDHARACRAAQRIRTAAIPRSCRHQQPPGLCCRNAVGGGATVGRNGQHFAAGLRRQQLPTAPEAAAASSRAAAGDDADALPQWRVVVGIAAGCLLLCNVHRSAFAVLLPELAARLQLRPSAAGLLQAAMLATYLLGQLPAGAAADKQGGLPVLLRGLCCWSAATALSAAAPCTSCAPLALGLLLLSRLGMGWCSACIMPCVTAIVAAWVAREQRASSLSFIYANFNVGGVLGLTLVPVLAAAAGVGSAFLAAGALGLLWAALALAVCSGAGVDLAPPAGQPWAGAASTTPQPPPPPAPRSRSSSVDHHSSGGNSIATGCLPGAGRSLAASRPGLHHTRTAHGSGTSVSTSVGTSVGTSTSTSTSVGTSVGREAAGPLSAVTQHLGRRLLGRAVDSADVQQVLVLCGTHAVMGWGFFLMQSWVPLYLTSLGPQALTSTGRLSSMPWLAAALVGMFMGSLADGLIKWGLPVLSVRRLMQCVAFWGSGAAVLPLALQPQPSLGLATGCLTANLAAYSVTYGGFHAYLQDVAGRRAGVLQGLTNSCSILTGIAGTVTTGWLLEATGSYSRVFALLAAMYGAAGVLWLACTSSHQLH